MRSRKYCSIPLWFALCLVLCIVLNAIQSGQILKVFTLQNINITQTRIDLLRIKNMQRVEKLQQNCMQLNLTQQELTKKQMRHFNIDRKHKLLYCDIPKVSFFVKWIVMLLKKSVFRLEVQISNDWWCYGQRNGPMELISWRFQMK